VRVCVCVCLEQQQLTFKVGLMMMMMMMGDARKMQQKIHHFSPSLFLNNNCFILPNKHKHKTTNKIQDRKSFGRNQCCALRSERQTPAPNVGFTVSFLRSFVRSFVRWLVDGPASPAACAANITVTKQQQQQQQQRGPKDPTSWSVSSHTGISYLKDAGKRGRLAGDD
jgi:hypothetical protein